MQVERRSNNLEQFVYTSEEFPAFIVKGALSNFPNHACMPHWHEEIELTVVLSGQMDYQVNSQHLRLQAGEGIFINARQIHCNYSREKEDCEYICIIFHPMLLCSSQYIERRFVTPVTGNPAFPCQPLQKGAPWAAGICETLKDLYAWKEEPESHLAVQAALFQIWSALYRHAPLRQKAPKARSQNLNALKEMIAYIQSNYQNKISLEDIARVGNMSKTSCCGLFQKYVNQSPNAYLIEYRLRSGIELLRATDMPVAEICFEVGFSGPSYFSESFRKAFGCSPMEYRRRERARENAAIPK